MDKVSFLSRKSVRGIIWKGAVYTIVGLGCCIVLIPFLWMFSTSLKELGDVFLFPPEWIPRPVMWRNYIEGWTSQSFNLFLKNSLTVSLSVIVGRLLTASIVAYGFARLRARGRDFIFIVVLSTMMLPPQVTLVPTFILFRRLGWVNTFKPLILPPLFGRGAFFIFLLRQFFMTIPRELDDAARIDGCGTFGIFWKIILPLSKPALAAVCIFTFMYQWNAFLQPLIYLNSESKYTLALGLLLFRDIEEGYTLWNQLMAVSLLVLMPCILVFFFAQRYFIQGVVITGLKG